ncbi:MULTISPECIES: AbrB/MazE/SpoVT family DNA-binding domain-containing protein [unclassified Candidatus Frackibacter]|uniref:AbrB/MazE/SpoVT family DNA-binding domain-containing protein n=1 Tax=unclassified Candidatus Frackibacter TaxID=2648818 RepID=UPI000799B0D5|nr:MULTISPECIES: AbrB/MazE/SpoVT family DNA-binding domain-containing protein [unclassified Candidatus Frackibacter]KXS36772.1 MAG: AbrB family transcriptional regulator [Candidatus Frackibacter sp. T328-2]SDC07335.1 looped-hinge helix DNA binding domain-containing protein, AbrB family [Candidatus Frackibacter sp. WG11]SEM38973.1 looped-hinge helix DNA binding domain-containing protein, AbrB family [Candidatus Frackibacter sp. WG12]SFL44688.1 looped-hinge helix DNA binding domain-containing pro
MSEEKIVTKVDDKGRITIPKKVRKSSGIDKGEVLFIDVELGQLKLTRAVEDPIVKLKEYTEKEYENGKTKNLRQYAKEKGMDLDD